MDKITKINSGEKFTHTSVGIYIILSGAGDFQVNDTAFPIAEGSIVRVATACNRSIRCTSTEKMLYICIQAKEGSLEQCTMEDGEITQQETKW